jgi:hypothetical protein
MPTPAEKRWTPDDLSQAGPPHKRGYYRFLFKVGHHDQQSDAFNRCVQMKADNIINIGTLPEFVLKM